MGTSTSTLEENNADKDKLLRKAGPQLTQQEGQAVKKTFIAISGKEDRPVFEEAHLQVSVVNSITVRFWVHELFAVTKPEVLTIHIECEIGCT